MSGYNGLIVESLNNYWTEAKANRDTWRARAYSSAIKKIKNLNYNLKSGAEARKIKGIGAKIAEKIDIIIAQGAVIAPTPSTSLTEFRQKEAILQKFTKIWGVGPTRAEQWYGLGHRTLETIIKDPNIKLTDQIKIGIKYQDDFEQRIPRKEIKQISQKIKKVIDSINKNYFTDDGKKLDIFVKTCGSYRRQMLESGDLDILITNFSQSSTKGILNLIINELTESGILTDHLAFKGNTKYMGVAKLNGDKESLGRRIDMYVVDPVEWPFALLYFTGCGDFNREMRTYANTKGFKLNEKGLWYLDHPELRISEEITSEKDIFEFLGLDYLEPKDRI